METWQLALELNQDREIVAGSAKALARAIRRGADLRIGTEFRHNEHIDVQSTNPGLIRETAEFGVTYLLDDHWTAGFMNLRMPITLLGEDGFGPRAGMSFFLYNQDGQQAVANLFFEGDPTAPSTRAGAANPHPDMPKSHLQETFDADTVAPSRNFIYDFDCFRFYVRDNWQEVLSHDSQGTVLAGSLESLADAFGRGCEVKVGIRGLCNDLSARSSKPIEHEVFVRVGSGYYYYCDDRLFAAGTHPLIRVAPTIPLLYASRSWDVGWLLARTDGVVARWLCDPPWRIFRKSLAHCAMRWFVR